MRVFSFVPLPNVFGIVDGFHASRFDGGYVDSVIVRGDEFAHAARVRNEFRPRDPLRDPEVVWFRIGELKQVIEGLRMCRCSTRDAIRALSRSSRFPAADATG